MASHVASSLDLSCYAVTVWHYIIINFSPGLYQCILSIKIEYMFNYNSIFGVVVITVYLRFGGLELFVFLSLYMSFLYMVILLSHEKVLGRLLLLTYHMICLLEVPGMGLCSNWYMYYYIKTKCKLFIMIYFCWRRECLDMQLQMFVVVVHDWLHSPERSGYQSMSVHRFWRMKLRV